MASLVVRNLDQRIVDALEQRAARHGKSAEAEHRAILEEVLLGIPSFEAGRMLTCQALGEVRDGMQGDNRCRR